MRFLPAPLFCVLFCGSILATPNAALAQGVYAGSTSRSERHQGIASKLNTSLGEAYASKGIDDVSTTKKSSGVREDRTEDLGRILKDARGRFFDTDFKAASKRAFSGIQRFEERFAFTNNRDAWALYGELTFVRTMALQRLGEKAKADRTLAVLASVYPSYVPDPGLVPPKVASRFQQVTARLNKMGRISLSIQSRPAGAEITLDGKSVGVTPLDVKDILPGPHFVAVSLGEDRATEKVVVRNGKGEVKFDIGDPRAGKARAMLSALTRAQSSGSILDAAKELDARTYAAVVLPAGGDIDVLVGRFEDGELAAVVGTPIRDDLTDLGPALERLVQMSSTAAGEIWAPREGEPKADTTLKSRFLGIGTGAVVGPTGPGEEEAEGEFPIGIVAVGGGVVAAVVVAAAVGGGVYLLLSQPSNSGGTDFLIDASLLD